MKFLDILLWVSIVAVVTAVLDPLQHVLQEVEQLKRSNEAMKKQIASFEQQLKWQRNLSLQSGEFFHKILSKYLSIPNIKTH